MNDYPTTTADDYPVTFGVEYPDRDLSRLTTGFRIFVVIPILIVLALLSGGGSGVAAANFVSRANDPVAPDPEGTEQKPRKQRRSHSSVLSNPRGSCNCLRATRRTWR